MRWEAQGRLILLIWRKEDIPLTHTDFKRIWRRTGELKKTKCWVLGQRQAGRSHHYSSTCTAAESEQQRNSSTALSNPECSSTARNSRASSTTARQLKAVGHANAKRATAGLQQQARNSNACDNRERKCDGCNNKAHYFRVRSDKMRYNRVSSSRADSTSKFAGSGLNSGPDRRDGHDNEASDSSQEGHQTQWKGQQAFSSPSASSSRVGNRRRGKGRWRSRRNCGGFFKTNRCVVLIFYW